MTIKKYRHGIATYPTRFRQIVVSKGKICLQFNNPQCKIRKIPGVEGELKQFTEARMGIEVHTHPIELGFMAVGMPLELAMEAQHELIKAYKEHKERFGPILDKYLTEFKEELEKIID